MQVMKRKLVKRKVIVAKGEEKPQSTNMPDSSDEVRRNQDLKNEENSGNNRNVDSKESVEELDTQNTEARQARLDGEKGDDEMFIIPEDDIGEKSLLGSEDAKNVVSLTDTITINEKQLDDDTNITDEVLSVPEKKVINQMKLVKKRKLVKRKVVVAKDEEKPQSTNIPHSSDEVRTNQDVKNEENSGNNRNVDSKESVEELDTQNTEARLGSEKVDDEMVINSEDDIGEKSLLGSEDAKNVESLTDTITINEKQLDDDTNITKEVLLVPEKKVVNQMKLVKNRKLVKRKVSVAKDEEMLRSSSMVDSCDVVRTNQDGKNEENPGNNSNVDSKESVEEVDTQNTEGRLDTEGDDAMFIISEDDIREESVIGSEDSKDLEPVSDTITINEKLLNDDSDINEEVSLAPKEVIKRKKLVRKRKLVKGIVPVSKDGEKPQSSDMPGPSDEVIINQDVRNKENPDGKIMDNVNKSSTMRTKKKNSQLINDKMTIKSRQSEENKQAGKEKMVSEIEGMGDLNEETKSETKTKLSKLNKVEVTAEDKEDAGPLEKQNSSNKVESMGMIFMCNSKTKEDCYHYKILGLPASKKDQVLKIYKGMRVFLFDTDLKLLYGIYKAAEPGGYNIEPKAFKSNYPSQVRFTTVNDCCPLPEEKFKKVIKDNYYTKNKFQCELNSKQVKTLCRLFRIANKDSKLKAKAVVAEIPKARVHPVVEQDKKRKARIENNDQGRERRALVDRKRDNKRQRVSDEVNHSRARVDTRPFRARADSRRQRPKQEVTHSRAEEERLIRFEEDARRLRLEEEERRLRIEEDLRRLRADDRRVRSPLALTDNRYPRHADVFERDAFLPSAALSAPLHLDSLPYTSPYNVGGRSRLMGDYRLDTALQNEVRGLQYSSRPRNLYEYEPSYLPYREPAVYRDLGYDVSTRQSYYSPLASRDEYIPSSSRASRYQLSPYRRY